MPESRQSLPVRQDLANRCITSSGAATGGHCTGDLADAPAGIAASHLKGKGSSRVSARQPIRSWSLPLPYAPAGVPYGCGVQHSTTRRGFCGAAIPVPALCSILRLEERKEHEDLHQHGNSCRNITHLRAGIQRPGFGWNHHRRSTPAPRSLRSPARTGPGVSVD